MAPRLDGLGLVVDDMAATLAFYRTLGLDIPLEAADEPHVELDLGGGVRFMMDTSDVVRSFDAGWEPPTGRGRLGLAVRCDDPDAVDDLYRRVIAAGYAGHLAPWDAVWGQRYAAVTDPNGIVVDLYAPLV